MNNIKQCVPGSSLEKKFKKICDIRHSSKNFRPIFSILKFIGQQYFFSYVVLHDIMKCCNTMATNCQLYPHDALSERRILTLIREPVRSQRKLFHDKILKILWKPNMLLQKHTSLMGGCVFQVRRKKVLRRFFFLF